MPKSLQELFSEMEYTDLPKSLQELFSEMEYTDLWPDAEIVSAVQYVRGSKALEIPSEWRAYVPAEL